MITKTKTSITLSSSVLKELSLFNRERSISQFIENALIHYIKELKRQERGQRDIEIINANGKRLNREAEENLKFQAIK